MTTIILGQISKIKQYTKLYNNSLMYTMTVKPIAGIENVFLFMPTKAMVYGYKRYSGYIPVSENEYTERYLDLLYKRQKEIILWYKQLPDRPLLLCCYCRPGVFCHRKIVEKYFLWLNSKLQRDYEIILD